MAAAALQATVVVQQTRTALEIQQQQNALAAEQTRTALQAKATQAALQATRVASEARDRDNRAVATSVAISIAATAEAQAAQAADTQRRQDATFTVLTIILCAVTLAALYLIVLLTRRGARFIRTRSPAAGPRPGGASSAALIVIDQASGTASARLPEIEIDDTATAIKRLRRLFRG